MTDETPGSARPGGTVYGRGGVDARPARPAGPPRALTAIAGAGIVAVIGLAFVAWNSTGGKAETPAAIPVPASAAVSSPSPSASPSPEAPPTLAAGSWLVSPHGEPGAYLTVAGDFATVSAEPAALTVVTGLADDTCFSFRTGDDRYLRHFDYRLRFATAGDSDLFRADATFCREDGAEPGAFLLRSKNYPQHLLHRRDDGTLYIDEPTGDAAAFTFTVQPAG
ncbi:AbfB domain-containing protein [Actinoplanes sp. NPDC023714]|uniref:AbfB domain-containing protein n=1 Tax=Actinoplanes sp. NPDC023714 TaxID=3154322 RepID=UPI0033E9A19C